MKITEATVSSVGKLARLAMTQDEMKRFAEQLSSILTYAEKLNELDTAAIEPTSHVLPLSNIFREDFVAPSLSVDAVMQNAPEKEGNVPGGGNVPGEGHFFRVPKIIE